MSILPPGYYEYPLREAEREALRIVKLRKLTEAFYRLRYVFGGAMWFAGEFLFFGKEESDTIEAEDINNFIDFLQLYLEFLEEVAGV